MSSVASVENWHRQDPSNPGQLILVDPIEGRDVDPTRPPEYIQNDPELRRGLDYMVLRDRRAMLVNVSLGPGEEADDLPPVTEHIIDETDAFAHDIQTATLPDKAAPGSGYTQRVQQLIARYVARKQVFCHRPSEVFTAGSADANIFTLVDAYYSGMENGLSDISMFVGAAVLQNAVDWYSAAKLGAGARDAELAFFRPTRVSGRWEAFALGDMLSGFDHKLRIAGADEVVEEPFRRFAEDWPEGATTVRNAALTGKLVLA